MALIQLTKYKQRHQNPVRYMIWQLPHLKKENTMFGLFNNKSTKEKLQEKYQKLTHEAFTLSKTNRAASDEKYAEAEQVQKEIEALNRSES